MLMEPGQKNSSERGFFIAVGCPGCGGELEIQSDFFVTSCSHCGSPLRLNFPDIPPAYLLHGKISEQDARVKIDRQLKTNGRPLTGQSLQYKNVYYPYWKIEAMLLRCRNRKDKIAVHLDDSTGEEFIDYQKNSSVNLAPYQITIAASNYIEGIPDSLGVRGDSLKVVPFAASKIEGEFDVLEVHRSPDEVLKTVELSVASMSSIELAEFGENVTKLFNPKYSLIFFPYCIVEDYTGAGYRRYILDGLTGRILLSWDSEQVDTKAELQNAQTKGSNEDELTISDLAIPEKGIREDTPENVDGRNAEQVKFGALEVVFHRCDECGSDLPAKPSCVYICPNCHELTCLDKQLNSKPEVVAADIVSKDASFFPFWTYRVNLNQQLNFTRDSQKVFVPAFKMANFEAMYRLCRKATSAASKFEFVPIESFDERFANVDILPTQGIALANVVNYRFSLEKSGRLPSNQIALDTTQLTLCYIPFKPENYFFVDSVLNSVTFEKSTVAG